MTHMKSPYKQIITLIFFFSANFLFGSEIENFKSKAKNTTLVLDGTMVSGMFSVYGAVLGALKLYDQKSIDGLVINFNKGLYLDPDRGSNWWDYYFLPITIQKGTEYTCNLEEVTSLAYEGLSLPKEDAYGLIQKYIHLQPIIEEKINSFVDKEFSAYYMIGVHHRGTDKITEWPIVSYKNTYKCLKKIIRNLPKRDQKRVKIFVATDEQPFIEYLKRLYPSQLIIHESIRSTNGLPVHYGNEYYSKNYQKGEDALIDCILLSKCNVLIRPKFSCLSLVSTYYNPSAPVYSLTGN